ncbi:hypothetical protein HYX01_03020 [Candidatus Woesearchaeota archaeon]|nr:hypothetical protein [Candidatus Woesearchaeota archaeon]
MEIDYNPKVKEAEDPPESIKTPWKLWKEWRNPLHKLDERLDMEHRIISYKWDLEMLHSFMHDNPEDEEHFEAKTENEATHNFEDYLFEFDDENHAPYSASIYLSDAQIESEDKNTEAQESLAEILEDDDGQTTIGNEDLKERNENTTKLEDSDLVKADYLTIGTIDSLIKALK